MTGTRHFGRWLVAGRAEARARAVPWKQAGLTLIGGGASPRQRHCEGKGEAADKCAADDSRPMARKRLAGSVRGGCVCIEACVDVPASWGVGLLGRQRAIPWSLLGGRRPAWTCDDGCAGHGLMLGGRTCICRCVHTYTCIGVCTHFTCSYARTHTTISYTDTYLRR